jgi:hypothetical protein
LDVSHVTWLPCAGLYNISNASNLQQPYRVAVYILFS